MVARVFVEFHAPLRPALSLIDLTPDKQGVRTIHNTQSRPNRGRAPKGVQRVGRTDYITNVPIGNWESTL